MGDFSLALIPAWSWGRVAGRAGCICDACLRVCRGAGAGVNVARKLALVSWRFRGCRVRMCSGLLPVRICAVCGWHGGRQLFAWVLLRVSMLVRLCNAVLISV